tara:strand:- start:250 stop:471 length:222 start_codon:yes stop_codon:yes gene_type:complete
MDYIEDKVIRAFKRLHNNNDNSDIYLPPDVPEEVVIDDGAVSLGLCEGFWVKNCNVWISAEQIEEQLNKPDED